MTPKPLQRRYVAYYRVSTERQGRSGLGLEAQRRTVADFIAAHGATLSAQFTETLSGGRDDRPQLAEALRLCRITHSTLLIAKLDRLSRNAAMILQLQQAGVRFVACEMPEMNETVVGMMAVMAQWERRAISERTKAALAAAKKRGVRLGNPRLKPGTAKSAAYARSVATEAARSRAEDLRGVVEEALASGYRSLRQLAGFLTARQIPTARDKPNWEAASVQRLLLHLGILARER